MTSTARTRLYARHADAADRGRWSVERDVRWDAIDVEAKRLSICQDIDLRLG